MAKKDIEDFELSAEEKQKKVQLEAKEGVECFLVKAGGASAWFKGPQEAEIDLFMAEQLDDKTKGSAMLDLARRNKLEQSPEDCFKRKPGLIVPMSQSYARAVGLTIDALLGK